MRKLSICIAICFGIFIASETIANPIPAGEVFWVDGGSLWDDSNCPNAPGAGNQCYVESDVGLSQFMWNEECGCWWPIHAENGDDYIGPGVLYPYFDDDGYAGAVYAGYYEIGPGAPNPWTAFDIDPTCYDFYNCTAQGGPGGM